MRSLPCVDACPERAEGGAARRDRPFVTGRSGRRAVTAGALALLLSACETDPVGNHLWGFGDPVRGAALSAPRDLGDTSRWDGQPARAALVAAQLEFLAFEFRTNPRYAPAVNPATTQQLDRAREEMRGFLGIAPAAPPPQVIAALRQVSAALEAGDRGRAETILNQPAIFTAGPLVTLARLSAMPRLEQTRIAAGMAAAEIRQLDNRRV